MRPWVNKIELVGFFDAEPEDWPFYAGQLSTELLRVRGIDDDLRKLATEFSELRTNGATCEDFNGLLNAVYDWGDIGKRLWIGTSTHGLRRVERLCLEPSVGQPS